jgi:branched-chain amino acid transport system permease protein
MQDRTSRMLAIGTLLILALVPVLTFLAHQDFYLDMFGRIVVFAIAALSLDFIFGFGGMVSFGHAVYLGIGAYAVGILDFYGVDNGFVQFGAATLMAGLTALVFGAVALRTSGVYFIMITLALGQMVYFLAISINMFGGDDGLTINNHSDFGTLVDLGDPMKFYYFALFFLGLFLWGANRIVHARFGTLLRAISFNERRMIAIGFPTFRYKLAAFVLSGAVCGFAGALFANQTLFISPSTINWFLSGEIIIMVIAGGMASLIGPVLGAIIYLLLQYVLSEWTVYWPAVLGLILILMVRFRKQGVLGLLRGSMRAFGLA